MNSSQTNVLQKTSYSGRTTEKPTNTNSRFNLNYSSVIFKPSQDSQKQGVTSFIDWIRVEGHLTNDELIELLDCIMFGDPHYVQDDLRIKVSPVDPGYKYKCTGKYGQTILWREPNAEYKDEQDRKYNKVAVTLPGEYLGVKHGTWSSVLLLDYLVKLGLHPTRIDLTIEDFAKKLFPLDRVKKDVNQGNITGIKKYCFYESGTIDEGINGMTITLGSRESDSYIRLYETTCKHGHQANRWECEYKGDKSRDVCNKLLSKIADINLTINTDKTLKGFDEQTTQARDKMKGCLMAGFIASMAIGAVDFIDRTKKQSNGSLVECNRLEWWQDFINVIGAKVTIRPPKDKATLMTRFNWIQKQWAKSLCLLHDGLGIELLYDMIFDLIEKGRKRLMDNDLQTLEIIKQDGIFSLTGRVSNKVQT